MDTDKGKNYIQILDETNQMIQISDLETYSMQYANMPARIYTNHRYDPYVGEHCYKYMMGLDEQCPFCPMLQMGDHQDSFITEIDNGVEVFTVKTKKIMWEGKPSFIEYATDITLIKRAQQIFEHQMQSLLTSIPEAQGIFHVNVTTNQLLSSNGVSHNIDQLRNSSDIDTLIRNIATYIPDLELQLDFINTFCRDALLSAYKNGKMEIVSKVQSYFDDNSIRWARFSARFMMNPNTGDLECVFYGMDINDEKILEEKMKAAEKEKQTLIEKSMRDMLTGVYSKKAFEQLANEYVIGHNDQPYAILFTDLDHFKNINDTLGHLAGDQAIIDAAETLQTIFSNKDIVSRFGGDEFCILVKNIPEKTLRRKLDFMLDQMHTSYSDGDASVKITCSIGVAYCTGQQTDIRSLISAADKALYEAKRNGRNRYCIVEV